MNNNFFTNNGNSIESFLNKRLHDKLSTLNEKDFLEEIKMDSDKIIIKTSGEKVILLKIFS
jgi:hypothetical protein